MSAIFPRRIAGFIVLFAVSSWAPAAFATLPPLRGTAPPELIQARQAGLFPVPSLATPRGGGGRGRLMPDSPALTPTGNWHIPVLLVSFSDQPPRFQPSRFQVLLFDTTGVNPDGSMSEYFRTVSRGALRVTGDVFGWFTLPGTESFYANNGYGLNRAGAPQNLAGLVIQALQLADPSVNFNPYDRDGDGEVDYLLVVHVGLGAEAASGDRNHLWSVNSTLSGPWDHVVPYITNDLIPGSGQHIRVDHFSVLPERSWVDTDSLAEIGPYCHEFGHGLGWPDLYDASVIGGGPNLGPGNWCLMSSGAYGGGETIHPERPSRPCAWALYDAGWIPATTLSQSRSERFTPVADPNGRIYRLWWQGEPSTEYFLLENRQKTGYDADLPGRGLLVYHVMEDIIASRRITNRVNAGPIPGLRVEEADGHYDLTGRFNRGDATDPFPDSARAPTFGDETLPTTRAYDGRHSNVSLTEIARDGPDVRAWVQVTPFGWSTPAVSVVPGRLRTSGDRPLSRAGSNLDFLVLNEADSSRVYALRRMFDVAWTSPQLVSTVGGAGDPAWSDPVAGPRLALWTDRRDGNTEVYYRQWDTAVGPETRATFSPAFAFRPSGARLPGGKICLTWIDTRQGKNQLFYKLFMPGQEGVSLEFQISNDSLTPEVNEYALAATPTGRMVIAYTGRGTGVDEVYWQRFDPLTLAWSTPERLSDLDGYPSNLPDVVLLGGGLMRIAWRDNLPTRSTFLSLLYDPVLQAIVPSPPALFASPLPIATLRVASGPGDRCVLVTRASEPPNDRVLVAGEHEDHFWDVGLGPISAGSNAGGSDPIADFADDGTITALWIVAGSFSSEVWTTSRSAGLTSPVGVSDPPGLRPRASLSAAPNPATRFVRFSWSALSPGSRLAIYSPAGRRVARLSGDAGSAEWTGRDDAGNPLAPGIYFYRLEDEGGRAQGPAGKLVWLR